MHVVITEPDSYAWEVVHKTFEQKVFDVFIFGCLLEQLDATVANICLWLCYNLLNLG